VESLLEPENVGTLRNILQYHVTTSALPTSSFRDGQTLGMANGAKTTLRVEGDQVWINDARIVKSVRAENGMLHVIDAVLLPPE
jgi:transforming growth factor-beta-induced protein